MTAAAPRVVAGGGRNWDQRQMARFCHQSLVVGGGACGAAASCHMGVAAGTAGGVGVSFAADAEMDVRGSRERGR